MQKEGLLKRLVRKSAPYFIAGSLFLGSCKDVPVGPPIDETYDPVAVLNVNPEEGYAPLESTISCSDKNPSEADRYSLNIEEAGVSIESTKPINRDQILNNAGNYTAECTSYADGKSNTKSSIISVYEENNPPKPSVSQTAIPVDSVNLQYDATLKNLEEASLEVSRDGEQVFTDTITNPDYSKTFSYASNKEITKGDYNFKIGWKTSAGKDTSVTTSANIPNYDPEFDSSELNVEFDEEGSDTLNLESRISDTNPEDSPVITSASSLDGKTSVSLNDENNLVIQGNENKFGNYDVSLNISDGSGGAIAATIGGYIHPWARVSGIVRNVENENLAGEESAIKVYDKNWNELKTGDTDTQGNFNIKVKKRASSLELLVIQAAHGTMPENKTGYVRTETIPGQLANPEGPEYNTNIEVMAVPFDPYTSNPEDFKKFFEEFGFPNKFDFDGRYLRGINSDFQDFDGLKRIRILDSDPCTDSEFTQGQQKNIKENILDPNDINAIVGNYEIKEDIIKIGNEGEGVDYIFNCYANQFEKSVLAEPGVLLYVPREGKYLGHTGLAIQDNLSNIIYAGTVLGVPGGSNGLWSHETGHNFLTSPHPTALGNTESVMVEDFNSPSTLRADHKAGKIIYHELGSNDGRWSHFIKFNGVQYPGFDSIENILGTDFGPKNKLIHKNGKYWHGN